MLLNIKITEYYLIKMCGVMSSIDSVTYTIANCHLIIKKFKNVKKTDELTVSHYILFFILIH